MGLLRAAHSFPVPKATTGALFSSDGPALFYKMRGFDVTLGRSVYWGTAAEDATGAEYTGPGPLTEIVVSHLIRTL